MGLTDALKHSVKSALDAVTGHAAHVALHWDERPLSGTTLTVRLVVTSTGHALHATGAALDLHGEDDLEEGMIDRLAELLPGQADPRFTLPIAGAFSLDPDQTKTLVATLTLPELDARRIWLARGRVDAPGVDPASPWQPFK